MLGVLAIYLGLTDENSLAVTFWAAEEGEQQIQVREIVGVHLGGTVRPGTSDQIIDTITCRIAYPYSHATGKGRVIGKKLT